MFYTGALVTVLLRLLSEYMCLLRKASGRGLEVNMPCVIDAGRYALWLHLDLQCSELDLPLEPGL